jgi:hypothetical protein
MTKIIMTESTKSAVIDALHVDIDTISDEALVDMLRNNPNFNISFKEAGQIKIKRVLKG